MLQEIMKKKILGISDAWLMSRLPIKPTTQRIMLKIDGFLMALDYIQPSNLFSALYIFSFSASSSGSGGKLANLTEQRTEVLTFALLGRSIQGLLKF